MFLAIKRASSGQVLYVNTRYIITIEAAMVDTPQGEAQGTRVSYQHGDFFMDFETTEYLAYNLAAIINEAEEKGKV